MKDPEYINAARNDAPFLSFRGGAEWTRDAEKEQKTYEPIAPTMPKE